MPSLPRREFLRQSSLAGVAALLPNAFSAPAAGRRKNVLFIAVDDLRPQLGCYGDAKIRTPHIDALAATGTVFTSAYCQQAVCNPSRASLLTGLRPDSTHIYNLSTHFRKTIPDVVTLPQHFKANGYHTQGLGKIYHGNLDDPISWSAPHWSPSAPTHFDPEIIKAMRAERDRLNAEGVRTQKVPLETDPKTGTTLQLSSRHTVHGPSWEAPDKPDGDLYDGKTTLKALSLLAEYKETGKPFFLGVGYIRPHLPFVAPKKYFDMYPLDEIELASNPFPPRDVPEMAMYNSQEPRDYTDVPAEGPIPEETRRKMIRAYRACASFIDAQVGLLMAELDRLGLADDTVVILWGDHGWHLGEHDIWGKMTNFEIATRVPMIIHAPGQKNAGAKSAALCEFVDIYPTLCELCDLPLPGGLEGTSLVPLLARPDRAWKSAAFSQYPRRGGIMGYSMRTKDARYAEWRKGDEVVGRELYDYTADPEGNVNLAGRPESAARVAELSKRLAAGWKAARPR